MTDVTLQEYQCPNELTQDWNMKHVPSLKQERHLKAILYTLGTLQLP